MYLGRTEERIKNKWRHGESKLKKETGEGDETERDGKERKGDGAES